VLRLMRGKLITKKSVGPRLVRGWRGDRHDRRAASVGNSEERRASFNQGQSSRPERSALILPRSPYAASACLS